MLAGSLLERNSLKQAIYFNCSSLKVLAAERSSLEIRSAQTPPSPSWPKSLKMLNAQVLKMPNPPGPPGQRVSKISKCSAGQPVLKCKSQLVKETKCDKVGQKALAQSKNIWRLVLCVRTGWQKLCEGRKVLTWTKILSTNISYLRQTKDSLLAKKANKALIGQRCQQRERQRSD